jgi:two-component system cell cycle sensor histidine kinase/response regulator CckA
VLYMSGYSEGVLTHHGIVDQNLTLLPKPFTTTSLLQKIREVLSRESSGAHKK